jgi:hypothetical protein
VKRRLYKHLRSSGSLDWVNSLSSVTEGINNSPMEALGFLTPNSIRSGMDEPRVREAQRALANKMTPKQRERVFPHKETYDDMMANLEEYKNNSPHDIELGSYVYLDRKEDRFTKADELQRGRIYFVNEILTHLRPLRYKLKGLLDPPEDIPGSYYRESLRLVPESARPKNDKTFWKIDHIMVRYY